MRTIAFAACLLLVANLALGQPSALNRVEQSLQPSPSGSGGQQLGYAGFEPDEEAEDGRGVHVKGVRPGTPADAAGMKPGDLIVTIDGKPIRNLNDYDSVMAGRLAGAKLVFVVDRSGRQQSLAMQLGAKVTNPPANVSDLNPVEPLPTSPSLTAPGGTNPAAPLTPSSPGSFGSSLQPSPGAPSLTPPGPSSNTLPPLTLPSEPSPRTGGITAQPLDTRPPGNDSFTLPGPSTTPGGPAAGGNTGGGKPSLGITVDSSRQPASRASRRGAYIADVKAGSPAANAGLPIGAVIVQMDRLKINSDDDLINAIRAARAGQEVELSYYDSADRFAKKFVQLGDSGAASGAGSAPSGGFAPGGGFAAPGGGFGAGGLAAQNPGSIPEPSSRPGSGGSGRPLINRIENAVRGAGILPPSGPTGPTTVYDPLAMAALQRQVADLTNTVSSLEERLRAVESKSGITSPAPGGAFGGASSPFGTSPSSGAPTFGSPQTPGFGSPSPSITPGFGPSNP